MSNEITDIKSDTGTPADKAPAPVKRSWIARFHGIILFLKASVASQIASWVDMGMGIILSQLCGLDVKLSTALGAVTGGIINCSINYKWTFRANSCSVPAVVVKYAMVWLGSLLLNTYGTDFMTTVFQSSTTPGRMGPQAGLVLHGGPSGHIASCIDILEFHGCSGISCTATTRSTRFSTA